MGCSRDYDWLPCPYVLPLDMSLVLRREARSPQLVQRHQPFPCTYVGSYRKGNSSLELISPSDASIGCEPQLLRLESLFW